MVKKIVIGSLCLAATLHGLRADSTSVNFDSGDFQILNQNTGASIALTGGTTNDGDGAVLQLGYFTGATAANNFAGTWVALSGEGSLNTAIVPGSVPPEGYNKTSIGDRNAFFAGDGTFALSLTFTAGDAASGNSLPPAGTILSIRFYNATTIASSSFYNIVSNDTWVWQAPVPQGVNIPISLNDPGLEWLSIAQGGAANTAFHTTIPTAIPEPSTLACLLFGGAGTLALGKIRRRFKS
jgi:hypothetical protein